MKKLLIILIATVLILSVACTYEETEYQEETEEETYEEETEYQEDDLLDEEDDIEIESVI